MAASSQVSKADISACLTDVEKLHVLLHTDAVRSANFDEILRAASGKNFGSFWTGLAEHLRAILHDESFSEQVANYERAVTSDDTTQQVERSFKLMQQVSALAHQAMDDKDIKLPSSFVDVVLLLHDQIFFVKGDAGETLRSAILKLCMRYFAQGRAEAEAVTPQMVPALLVHATQPEAKEADVKRLMSVKEAFFSFDLDHETADGLKELILRTFMSPMFLRTKEAQRFLEFALTLNADLVKDIHSTVLNQIPSSNPQQLQALGNVYFKAWAKADGAVRLALESAAIQDLMHKGITAAVPATFASVRRVLGAMAEHKKAPGVDAMLTRLFAPVLWRALDAPNAGVRRNAAVLWLDTFPLGDISGPTPAYEALLQKQFDALAGLLVDASPEVRVVGVHGAARVLSQFWELIPTATIKAIVGTLVTQCARDASAYAVRAAVADAVAFLLDQPLAHGTVAQVLPLLAPLLHDKHVKVRAACARLLLALQPIKGIAFYDMLPVDDVLARLVVDAEQDSVSGPLVQLLLPSFLPAKASGSELATRALKALTRHPAAALQVYARAGAFVSCSAVGKMLLVFHKAVAKAIKAADKGTGKKRSRGAAAVDGDSDVDDAEEAACAAAGDAVLEGEGVPTPVLHAGNEALMSGLLRAALALWQGAAESLNRQENDGILQQVLSELSGEKLLDWLRWFAAQGLSSDGAAARSSRAEIVSALAGLSAQLPVEQRAGVSQWVLQRVLVAVPGGAHSTQCPPELPSLVDSLCFADSEGELLQACKATLLATLQQVSVPDDAQLHPAVAAWCLSRMLACPQSQARLLGAGAELMQLGDAVTSMLSLAAVAGDAIPVEVAVAASVAFNTAVRAAALMAVPAGEQAASSDAQWRLPQEWGVWCAWLTSTALPLVQAGNDTSRALSASCMSALAAAAADIATAGGASDALADVVVQWTDTRECVAAWVGAAQPDWEAVAGKVPPAEAAAPAALSHLLRCSHRLCAAATGSHPRVCSTSATALASSLVRVLLVAGGTEAHSVAKLARSTSAAAVSAAMTASSGSPVSALGSFLPALSAAAAPAADVAALECSSEHLPSSAQAATSLFHGPDKASAGKPLQATASQIAVYCEALVAFLTAVCTPAGQLGATDATVLPVAGVIALMGAAATEAPASVARDMLRGAAPSLDALLALGLLAGASAAQKQVARFAADLRAAAQARDAAEGIQASSLAAVSAV